MKKVISLLLTILSGSAFGAQVTILGINDMHANIDKLPHLAACLKSERAEQPELLLLSAGDNRTGSPYVDAVSQPGMPMIQLMNQLGFDLSCLGNHEFDSGKEALRNCIDAAQFPFICANVSSDSRAALNLKPYHFFERNGVRICVLGLLQLGIRGQPDVHPDCVRGLEFRHPFDVVRDYAFLREKCDILILLTHLGFEDDVRLANLFPEADVIIGGHTHTRVEKETIVNGVLITQAENKVQFITRITFDVADGHVTKRTHKLIHLRDFPADAEILRAVQVVKNNPEMRRELAMVEKDIPRRESLGCLMADALRHCAGTDIAVVNIGGVRLRDFPAGPIRVEDCYRLDPFGNHIVTLRVSGQELIDFLNAVPATDQHGAPCVSGMRYQATKTVPGRHPMNITKAYLENGEPITPEGIYTLATNSYLLSTVSALPADAGQSLDTDGAGSLIRFLEQMKKIDYSTVSRACIIRE